MKNLLIKAIALLLVLTMTGIFAVSCKDDEEEDDKPSEGEQNGTEGGEDGDGNGNGFVGEWDTEF